MIKNAIPNKDVKIEDKRPGTDTYEKKDISIVHLEKLFNKIKEDFKGLKKTDTYDMNIKFSTPPAKTSDPTIMFYSKGFKQKNSVLIEEKSVKKSNRGKPKEGYSLVRTLSFTENDLFLFLKGVSEFNELYSNSTNDFFSKEVGKSIFYKGLCRYSKYNHHWKIISIEITDQVSETLIELINKSKFYIEKSNYSLVSYEDIEKHKIIDNLSKGERLDIKVGVLDVDTSLNSTKDSIAFKSYVGEEEFLDKKEYDDYIVAGYSEDVNHGEIVSSLISFGSLNYSIEDKKIIDVVYCGVLRHDLEIESFETVKDRIIRAIKDNSDIRYWNFSMNIKEVEIDPLGSLSPIATWIDQIQNEYSIKIFASSGNKSGDSEGYLSPPSESIFASTISSLNFEGDPAAYTLNGFSNYRGIKPDMSDFGGCIDNLIECVSISKNKIFKDSGTSFASPMAFRKFIIENARILQENINPQNVPGTKGELLLLSDAQINIDKHNGLWKKNNHSRVGNGPLSENRENHNEYITWFIEPNGDLRYRGESYSKIILPYDESLEYKIYINNISNIIIDPNWGIEYVRMNISASLSIPVEDSIPKKLKSKNSISKINDFKLYDEQLNETNGKWRRIFSDSVDLFTKANKEILKQKALIENGFIKNVSLSYFKNHRILDSETGGYKESKDVYGTTAITSLTFVPKDPSDLQRLNRLIQSAEEQNPDWDFNIIELDNIILI